MAINLFRCSLDCLHQSQSRLLDLGECSILSSHQFLILLVEAFNPFLEGSLGLLLFLCFGSNLGIEVSSRHSLQLLNLCLFISIAEVDVGRRAHWLKFDSANFFKPSKSQHPYNPRGCWDHHT